MASLEFNKVLVLSTKHLTEQDSHYLADSVDSVNPDLIVYELGEYGYLIYVTNVKATALCKYSSNFKLAIILAQEKGCSYLRYDRDGNTTELLETYEW